MFHSAAGATRAAELEFARPAAVYWRTDGGRYSGSLDSIFDYYQRLRRGRLVIMGEAGSGKTVLAIALTSALAEEFQVESSLARARATSQGPRARVAVRVSAPAFDPTGGLPADLVTADQVSARLDMWLADYLRAVFGVGVKDARALIAEGWIVPVLDGVDEMDPPGPTAPRAALLMNALNRPALAARGDLRPVVLTCRSDRYAASVSVSGKESVSQDDWIVLQDATVVCVNPLTLAAAHDYILVRFPDPAGSKMGQIRWRPILDLLAAEAVPSAATMLGCLCAVERADALGPGESRPAQTRSAHSTTHAQPDVVILGGGQHPVGSTGSHACQPHPPGVQAAETPNHPGGWAGFGYDDSKGQGSESGDPGALIIQQVGPS